MTTLKRLAFYIGCALALIVGYAAGTVVSSALHSLSQPCLAEDSTWCHWDASERGNGLGGSHVAFWEDFTINLP